MKLKAWHFTVCRKKVLVAATTQQKAVDMLAAAGVHTSLSSFRKWAMGPTGNQLALKVATEPGVWNQRTDWPKTEADFERVI